MHERRNQTLRAHAKFQQDQKPIIRQIRAQQIRHIFQKAMSKWADDQTGWILESANPSKQRMNTSIVRQTHESHGATSCCLRTKQREYNCVATCRNFFRFRDCSPLCCVFPSVTALTRSNFFEAKVCASSKLTFGCAACGRPYEQEYMNFRRYSNFPAHLHFAPVFGPR